MYLAYRHIKKKRQEKRAAAAAAAEVGLVAVTDSTKESAPRQVSPTPEQRAAKKRQRIYRWKILLGLLLPFTLQGLDTTIVASALPYIAADFDQLSQLNWIISAFNLTAAAFLPFWSQMADVFGRHATLHATLAVMLVGSAICTGAPTRAFGVLLLGRALQGVGASGINICVRTILADRVSLKEYAFHWTIFALLSTLSFSVGPVVGGYLTESNWRWCFAINLPVAAIAIVVVVVLLRHELLGPQPLSADPDTPGTASWAARLATVDLGGQLLFLWGLGLVILALTWGGGEYAWSSAHVLAPLVVGVVLTVAWAVYERLMAPGAALARRLPRQQPMLPWELLSHRNIGLIFLVNVSVGVALFANLYFMDVYFDSVRGYSSSKSGVSLLYFLPGLGAGAFMAMFASNVWPRQTLPSLLLGSITSAVGITVLAYAVHTPRADDGLVYGMMALTGHGVGLRMNPGALHGLAFFPQRTAAISCLVSFALPFGGMVSLTLMSTVYNNRGGTDGTVAAAQNGIRWAFLSILPFMWLGVVLTTCLGNVWLITEERHAVVHGAYLWRLILGRTLEREEKTREAGRETVPVEV